jgi:hypothetical protein
MKPIRNLCQKRSSLLAPQKLTLTEKIKMVEQNAKSQQKSIKNINFIADQAVLNISLKKDHIHQVQCSSKYSLQNCEL